ncbi:polymer-forming cytoskeletal protein [Candidatus Haliotispira prima]|uniref:Polymer-forming cytoskeletal protein n=1 Tax=Candidatus Haliotispira prima TaxID=3034016 RepID=A0ABY8MFY8_9SPIO|nr:polymer-forming cytoskeletal protein [Candidatus Haliotispira prima]
MAEIHAKRIDEKKFSSLLQKDIAIKGEIYFPENVLIKGKIEGSLESRSEVVIDKHAEIQGNIQASHLQIQGSITGDIHCSQDVKIEQSARVTGDINTPNLNIEPGSFFEGRSIMNSEPKDTGREHS